MIRAYGVSVVREAEQALMARLPSGTLMQRAAAGLATVVADELRAHRGGVYGAHVVLLVGPGSNGGDALWAGARLAARGARVDAVLVAERAHAEGLAALRAAGGYVCSIRATSLGPPAPIGSSLGPPATARGGAPATGEEAARRALRRADVVVDGVLGIGGRPGVDEAVIDLLGLVPDGVPVMAVDLPSGVDPDTGQCPGPVVHADVTVTFGARKPCLLLPPASAAAGRVELIDIGLGPGLDGAGPAVERMTGADVAAAWPVPRGDTQKYGRGVVGVVAGGRGYTGAAVLATGAAVRSGAGMVRYVGPDEPTDLVRARWPEVVPGEGRVQAWVLGPGLDPEADDGQPAAVRRAMGSGLPCLVDAGALDLLPERVEGPVLLTPHAGELARLLSRREDRSIDRAQVQAAPLRHARRAAELTGATVLLKGATTLVVAPDGHVLSQADGPPWLATAGAGDVLAGLAGTLLAAGLEPPRAGAAAAAVHGLAGARASRGGPLSSRDLLDVLPAVVADLLREHGC